MQLGELLDGNASLSNEGAERALQDLAVRRNREPPVRWLRMPEATPKTCKRSTWISVKHQPDRSLSNPEARMEERPREA
jgi:hypothetical protein